MTCRLRRRNTHHYAGAVSKRAANLPPERARRGPSTRLVVALAALALALVAGWFVLGHPAGSAWTVPPGVTTASTRQAEPSASVRIDPASGLPWVALSALPTQVADTMREIKAGPPYAYPNNDGVVFHNAEGVLPKRPDGYYHEFTVETPGAGNRGARRIVAGGPKMGQANSEWYYTPDHYTTFERIRP